MEVTSLSLTDFRNYRDAQVLFAPGFNLIVGANGRGKTNLLEAIYLLSTAASHRTPSVVDVIRHGESRSVIRGRGVARKREVSIDAEVKEAGGIRFLVNKVALGSAREVAETLATIMFSPEDLGIVKGAPEERRRFLDHAAAKARPLAWSERQRFERVLRQRNGVLKAAQLNSRAAKTLDVWDDQFAAAAGALIRDRLTVLSAIDSSARKRYEQISPSGGVPEFVYRPSWAEAAQFSELEVDSRMRESLASSRERDLERGFTTVGPHRDDLLVKLRGMDARLYSSQGEQRSLVLALRLAERDLLSEFRGEEPVLLLDDVWSELDEARRGELTELVSASGQTIATAVDTFGIPLQPSRILVVKEGGTIGDA